VLPWWHNRPVSVAPPPWVGSWRQWSYMQLVYPWNVAMEFSATKWKLASLDSRVFISKH
jgi:hypothetical protein